MDTSALAQWLMKKIYILLAVWNTTSHINDHDQKPEPGLNGIHPSSLTLITLHLLLLFDRPSTDKKPQVIIINK